MLNEVLRLKLRPRDVPILPFYILYITATANVELLKRMFTYSIIFPANEVVRKQLAYIVPSKKAVLTQGAYGAKNTQPIHITDFIEQRNNDVVICSPVKVNRSRRKKGSERVSVYTIFEYLLRDPTYPKAGNPVDYFTGQSDNDYRNSVLQLLDTQATLHTPDEDIQPICMACSNSLNHIGGQCTLGDKQCKESLKTVRVYSSRSNKNGRA